MLRLARSGVTFSNAYAATPVCSSSRAALLTGQSPAVNRMTDWIEGSASPGHHVRRPENWVQNLMGSQVTLAESFRDAGYATGLFGKWHLSKVPGLPGYNPISSDPTQHGFDVNFGGSWFGNPSYSGGYFAGSRGRWLQMPGMDRPGSYPAGTHLSDALLGHASGFIQQQAALQQPFFMFMSEYLPHTPVVETDELVQKYRQKISQMQVNHVDTRGHTNASYAAMLERMDRNVGTLLDRLDDPNDDGSTADSIRDDTIILFTSDNGGLLGDDVTSNRPLCAGKGSLYEGGIREPMIVSWTGNPALPSARNNAGRVSKALFTGYDIAPTLLDLAQVSNVAEVNSRIDGVSVVDALEDQPFDRGDIFWHYPHHSPRSSGPDGIAGGDFVSAVRRDQWKLIWFYDATV